MYFMHKFRDDLFLKDESLKNYCTFKIGGNAKYLFIAHDTSSLLHVCKHCNTHNIRFKIIGLGANLLFDDLGFDGAIIVNRSNKTLIKNNSAYVDSGTSIASLIQKCYQRNLSNIEKLAGIPATVGGAIVNGLGSFDVNFCQFVDYVICYKKEDLNTPIKLQNKDCKFAYRNSIFKEGDYIITKAKINLKAENKLIIKQAMLESLKKKSATQPICQPSAGSIFKRGEIIPSKIIDELGLKGTRIGGAEISTKHAGFIVNIDNATSNDVKQLILLIQNMVKDKFNIDLKPEIEFV